MGRAAADPPGQVSPLGILAHDSMCNRRSSRTAMRSASCNPSPGVSTRCLAPQGRHSSGQHPGGPATTRVPLEPAPRPRPTGSRTDDDRSLQASASPLRERDVHGPRPAASLTRLLSEAAYASESPGGETWEYSRTYERVWRWDPFDAVPRLTRLPAPGVPLAPDSWEIGPGLGWVRRLIWPEDCLRYFYARKDCKSARTGFVGRL